MTSADYKNDLQRYLQGARDAIIWKLDGLSEYDVRRPMTPTGTNLLGVVKHLASVEIGYFGDSFGRPFGEELPWLFEADADFESLPPDVLMADMWAAADEPREFIVGLYQRVWVHSDATIELRDLEAIAQVPWWGSSGQVTLHRLLVHMIAETHRHAGHVDIARELIDKKAGLSDGNTNLPTEDQAWWQEHYAKLERVAREAIEL